MFKIGTTQLWVHDQEEALAFYTEKLGMEVRADVTLAVRNLRAGGDAADDIIARAEADNRGVALIPLGFVA